MLEILAVFGIENFLAGSAKNEKGDEEQDGIFPPKGSESEEDGDGLACAGGDAGGAYP